MLRTTLVTAVMTFGAFAPSAYASGMEETRVLVRYGDLDLSDRGDARILARRIDRAADRACGGHPRTRTNSLAALPRLIEDFEACRREAADNALAQIAAPEVRLAYEQLSARRAG